MVTLSTAKDASPEQKDESLKNIWASYQSSASIHGLAQVGGPRLYSFRKNVIDIRVFLESMLVLRITQEPAMTFNDILGTLGGHLGLFLGASILSITELTEVALLLVLRRMGYLGATNAGTAENNNGCTHLDVVDDATSAVELSSTPSSPSVSPGSPASGSSVDVARENNAKLLLATRVQRDQAALWSEHL